MPTNLYKYPHAMRQSKQRKAGEREELGEPRQVRFQRQVEVELEQIAQREGTDFPSVARMAVRRGLEVLKEQLSKAA